MDSKSLLFHPKVAFMPDQYDSGDISPATSRVNFDLNRFSNAEAGLCHFFREMSLNRLKKRNRKLEAGEFDLGPIFPPDQKLGAGITMLVAHSTRRNSV